MAKKYPPSDFRSYKEMDEVYQRLHKKGIVDNPYLVRLHQRNQILTFFGARHSNDVNDKQVKEIEREWHQFIANTNPRKVAFCEGGLRPLEKEKNDAIKKYSEPGLLTWLAHKDVTEVVSPEPDETKEIEYLQAQGFGLAEIATYYFGRQMYQWAKRDRLNEPDWKAYANRHIASFAALQPFKTAGLTLQTVHAAFKKTTGQPFDIQNERLLYQLSDPTSNSVSAASGIFRDISLFNAITHAWQSGGDIFALYGSGHAIVLEKAIQKLAGKL